MTAASLVQGRLVVVTGAASGIGAALAAEAVQRGAAHVAVLDLDGEGATAIATRLGPAASAWPCDVSDAPALRSTAAAIVDAHGVPGLIAANAGVSPASQPLLAADVEKVRWVLDVNVVGVLATFQAFAPAMVADPRPSWLLATGSEHSLGFAHAGIGAYTASKHALLGLTEVLRHELPAHVGLSLLCPGLTVSGLWDGERHLAGAAAPDPMAHAVIDRGMDPVEVATHAFDGIAAGRFLVPTHPHSRRYASARAAEVEAAFDHLDPADDRDLDVGHVVTQLLADLATSGGPA